MQEQLTGRILVAEDNPSNQMLVKLLLEKIGLEPTLVEDGQQVIEMMSRQDFDMILMDIQMPNKNGYEATEELRRKGFTLPIIALTAHAMKGDAEKCLETGCDGYLPKPIDRKRLYDTISQYLKAGARSRGQSANSDGQKAPSKQITDESLISDLAGDPELAPVVDVFIDELPVLIDGLRKAKDTTDMELLKGLAHQLKGASGSAGFKILFDQAAELEKYAAHKQIDNVSKAVNDINALCLKVIEKQKTK